MMETAARPVASHCCGRTGHFVVEQSTTTTQIAAFGEFDAANADEFADFVISHADPGTRVVVDLTGATFFGTAGFAALHQVAARVGRWTLVPGPLVGRLLRVCDPDAVLPVLLQLIPKAR